MSRYQEEKVREMLGLAAKAIGGEYAPECDAIQYAPGSAEYVSWQPHTDDGDSRRLQCALGIEVRYGSRIDAFYATEDDRNRKTAFTPLIERVEAVRGDKAEAYRYAVLRVAAEIGRKMP